MSTVHVVPLRDLIVHSIPGGYGPHHPDEGPVGGWLVIEAVHGVDVPECVCGPSDELVPSAEGDGCREIRERAGGAS